MCVAVCENLLQTDEFAEILGSDKFTRRSDQSIASIVGVFSGLVKVELIFVKEKQTIGSR